LLLEVKNLEMHYKVRRGLVRAVDDVSFSLEMGETLGVVGESGCGKSSLAFSILRLLPKNGKIVDGQVLFQGTDLTKLPEEEMRAIRWKKISMIFQAAMNALNPVQKVGDQLIEALQIHEDMDRDEAYKRVEELFQLVGLETSRAYNYPHEFSAGMKQRAIIAMSLVCTPELVIADEPTSALDVIVQDQIVQDMKDLQKKINVSMMMISHDLALVAEACEKISVMYGGKVMELAYTADIFRDTRNPYTRALLRSTPSIRGSMHKLASLEGTPPSLVDPLPGCRFEPRCVYAKEICRKELPDLKEVEDTHFSRCHFAEDLEFTLELMKSSKGN
jgi:peptide/nickel transport system ATP-binding protein